MIPFYESKTKDLHIEKFYKMNFPAHLHKHLELIYIYEGSLSVTVGSCSEVMSSGDMVLVFPNTVHKYEECSEKYSSGLMVIFSPASSGEFYNTIMKNRPSKPFILSRSVHKDIPYSLNGLYEEMQTGGDALVCHSFIQLILSRAMPLIELDKNSKSSDCDLTYKIIDYISQNYKDPISLEILSQNFGVTRNRLSHIFTSGLNTGFYDYLNMIRLDHASHMLRSSDIPITQICYDCGFETQRTFNRVFKNFYGISPSEYRDKIKSEAKQ